MTSRSSNPCLGRHSSTTLSSPWAKARSLRPVTEVLRSDAWSGAAWAGSRSSAPAAPSWAVEQKTRWKMWWNMRGLRYPAFTLEVEIKLGGLALAAHRSFTYDRYLVDSFFWYILCWACGNTSFSAGRKHSLHLNAGYVDGYKSAN